MNVEELLTVCLPILHEVSFRDLRQDSDEIRKMHTRHGKEDRPWDDRSFFLFVIQPWLRAFLSRVSSSLLFVRFDRRHVSEEILLLVLHSFLSPMIINRYRVSKNFGNCKFKDFQRLTCEDEWAFTSWKKSRKMEIANGRIDVWTNGRMGGKENQLNLEDRMGLKGNAFNGIFNWNVFNLRNLSNVWVPDWENFWRSSFEMRQRTIGN